MTGRGARAVCKLELNDINELRDDYEGKTICTIYRTGREVMSNNTGIRDLTDEKRQLLPRASLLVGEVDLVLTFLLGSLTQWHVTIW